MNKEQSLLRYSRQPPHKIKAIIKNKAVWRCKTPSDIACISKNRPKMLSTVQITHFFAIPSYYNRFLAICRALARTKRVSSFELHQSGEMNIHHLQHLLNSVPSRWKRIDFRCRNYWSSFPKGLAKKLIRLRKFKDLAELKIYIVISDNVDREVVENRLSQEFQHLKNLKRLHLDITQYFHRLIINYKLLKSLSCLNLKLKEGVNTYQSLSDLLENSCKSLRHFKLILVKYNHQDDEVLKDSLFQKLQNLKTLDLTKVFSSDKDPEIQVFCEGLKYLKHLTALSLHFSLLNPYYNKPTLSFNIFSSFHCFTQLEELRLNFLEFAQLSGRHLQDLFIALQHFPCLKTLDLAFSAENISHKSLALLSKSLKILTQLQVLSLNFKDIHINQKSIEAISNSIVHLNLVSFQLNPGQPSVESALEKLVSRWRSHKRALTPLFSAIDGFNNNLSNLSLDLSEFELSLPELKHFSLVLKNLKRLSSLSLSLPQFDPANNFESLQVFLSSLKELPCLRSLHLNFRGQGSCCDQEVYHIASSVKNWKCLDTLQIFFLRVRSLGKESLQHLLSGLKELLMLKHLEVLFWERARFKEKEIEEFLEGLTVLKGLETLKVHNNYQMFHSGEMMTLPDSLKGFHNLRHLTTFTVNNYAKYF